jgi:hypothetical protein
VCRQDGKLLFGLGVHPTADKTLARKRESVFAVVVDNGEFHIGAERSGIYWLPVHVDFIPPALSLPWQRERPVGILSTKCAARR